MTTGVLAPNQARARLLIRIEPSLVKLAQSGEKLIPLSPGSRAHRGMQLAGVFVDAALWPVPENLVEEIGPCLYQDGGGFYTRAT